MTIRTRRTSNNSAKQLIKHIGWVLILLWLSTMLWQTHKPLADGMHVNSAPVMLAESATHFLTDLTYQSSQDRRVAEQHIFDAVLKQVDEAQHFIVLDYFLVNDGMGASGKALRSISRELADHLLARKRAAPTLQVLLITDPINDVYGGASSALFAELRQAGIAVVSTDLTKLRDSNPGYSAIWRGLAQWFGNSEQGGWLPNPFDSAADNITLRSWLSLMNFKANHRKVVISDRADGEWVALIASANPHDASSAHSNVAVQFSGELVKAVFDSELAIARFSGWTGAIAMPERRATTTGMGNVELSYVTEGAILEHLLREIDQTKPGDQIHLAMFYLSERSVIDALKLAASRDVAIRIILDPNKDAFGIKKDGVPNRPVANELIEQGHGNIEVRWYRTHGEQFHTKLLLVQRYEQLFATLGSANFTRRNLDDYNLEANVAITMPVNSELATQMQGYFNRLWNGDALTTEYTAPFGVYKDDSAVRYWRYRLMEATGLSTF
ncbi:MAG: phospholipase D-like domain-containing protein [Steroidobacteraceae bacterium]